jgi:hypothetical protein
MTDLECEAEVVALVTSLPIPLAVELITQMVEALPPWARLHLIARISALHMLPHDRPTSTH